MRISFPKSEKETAFLRCPARRTALPMGNASLYAGQCIKIKGLAGLDGKYYIDKVKHTLGSGYTMQLDLSKV